MILLIESIGFLVAIGFVIVFFLVKGRKRKLLLAACALVVLTGFGAAVFFMREGLPLVNTPAPISASAQVIVSGASLNGQIAVESLNARDGGMRWRRLLNTKLQDIPPQPVVSGSIIYVVGADQTHQALVLYALRAQDGAILWSRTLGSYDQDAIWNSPGPLPMDGVVYIAVGHGINLSAPAAGVTTLYALHAENGVTLWTRQLESVAYHSQGGGQDPSVLAADTGRVFVNETDGQVHALRASDGANLWSAAGGVGTMGAGSGVLYQSGPLESLSIIALRESDGAQLWVQPFLSFASMAVAGNYLVLLAYYGSSENPQAFIIRMNASDGQTLWRYPFGSVNTKLVISTGVVYSADTLAMVALRLSDGHVLWKEQTPTGISSEFDVVTVAPQGNVAYVSTDPYIGEDPLFDPATCGCAPPTKVYALNAQDGSAYWQYQSPSTGGFYQIAVTASE